MTYSIDTIKAKSVPLSITRAALRKAQEFASLQSSKEKQHQVYYNTLAVYVVNDYIRMMGIETNLEASDSWNPVLRLAADVADLKLKLPWQGSLECRFIIASSLHSLTAPICYIPPEVPQNRIGIVVVALEPEEQQATLLGFSPAIETTDLAISQLQTIDDLLVHLAEIKTSYVERLSQWFSKQFETTWQSVESVLLAPKLELAFRTEKVPTAQRAKRIDLGRQRMLQSAILLVEATPTASEMEIVVRVQPDNGQTYLPEGLQLIVLDEVGEPVMLAKADSDNKNMQLQFSGELEEKFMVKLMLGDASVIENFVI